MTRARPFLLALALLAALLRPAEGGGGATTDVASLLNAAVQKCGVPADRFGIAVLERGGAKKVLFARGHTKSFAPASVAKVLTAATALDLLGPGHVFTTRVTARGEVDGAGTLHGDLVIHGSGDPNLSGRAFNGASTHVLDVLAAAAHDAGVRTVEGALVLDDGAFDRQYFHPDWKAGDKAKWYGAAVGGLSYNDSCIDLVVSGGRRVGQTAVLDVPSTAGPWQIDNRTETVASGDTVVHATWDAEDARLTVTGKVPLRGSFSWNEPVPEPVRFLGGAFLKSLAAAGVRVQGGMRLAAGPEDRRPGKEFGRHTSSLAQTLRVMNKRSQNFYASAVFKACGAALMGVGTWETGTTAVGEMLRRRSLSDEAKTLIVDGSGLSLENRTTAATVALVLADFDRDVLRGPVLRDSLAVPGEPGTLDDRFLTPDLKARLHAKTGTLGKSGVHALAGYLDGKDGKPGIAFAILVQHGSGRDLIDSVVRELAR